MELFTIKSHSKINLGLEIIAKRKDGFHELNSLFIPINLSDEITFQPSNKFEIIVSPNTVQIPLQENLIFKTVKLIQNQYKISIPNLTIKLKKKIPIGSGLGGGSSNATTSLLALNRYLNLNLSKEELLRLANELGSDAPFFLTPKPALIKGKGDIIEYFNIEIPFKILIIHPNFSISTKYAYSLVNFETPRTPSNLITLLTACLEEPKKLQEYFVNDFEQYIFPKYPILAEIKKKLLESGAYFASLSGSGSAIFGLFDSNFNFKNIKSKFTNFQIFVTKALQKYASHLYC